MGVVISPDFVLLQTDIRRDDLLHENIEQQAALEFRDFAAIFRVLGETQPGGLDFPRDPEQGVFEDLILLDFDFFGFQRDVGAVEIVALDFCGDIGNGQPVRIAPGKSRPEPARP